MINPISYKYSNIYNSNTNQKRGKYNLQDSTTFSGANSIGTLSLQHYWSKTLNRSIRLTNIRQKKIIPELQGKINEVIIKTKDGISLNCWDIPPNGSNKYVLYLHGMTANIGSHQDLISAMHKKGYGVFAVEYRSFGKNPKADVDEKRLNCDVDAAMQYLKTKVKTSDITIVSHSIGTTIATKLAKKNKDLKSLILISPIDGLKNSLDYIFLKDNGKIAQLIKTAIKKFPILASGLNKQYRTSTKLKKIQSPISIIHSKDDEVVALQVVKKLAIKALKAKKLDKFFVLQNGGHRVDRAKIQKVLNILDD